MHLSSVAFVMSTGVQGSGNTRLVCKLYGPRVYYYVCFVGKMKGTVEGKCVKTKAMLKHLH